MKRYFINVFMLGVSQRGVSHSDFIGRWIYDAKIDFQELRTLCKDWVVDIIDSGSPCVKESHIYYNVICINYENQDEIGTRHGKVKLTSVLKWKDN